MASRPGRRAELVAGADRIQRVEAAVGRPFSPEAGAAAVSRAAPPFCPLAEEEAVGVRASGRRRGQRPVVAGAEGAGEAAQGSRSLAFPVSAGVVEAVAARPCLANRTRLVAAPAGLRCAGLGEVGVVAGAGWCSCAPGLDSPLGSRPEGAGEVAAARLATPAAPLSPPPGEGTP